MMKSLNPILIGLLLILSAATLGTAAPAANAGVASITISCSQPVRILPLEVGQQAKYDLAGWSIKHIDLGLSGWQFVSVPHRKLISYNIHINQSGVLYAFGSSKGNVSDQGLLGSEDNKKWEDAAGAISGPTVKFCFRRKIFAGEIIKLKGIALQIAAKSCELGGIAVAQVQTSPASTAAIPPAASAPSTAGSGDILPDANQSPTKILSQQAPNATAWALAPLEQPVPGDIRQNLTYLRENLLDEGKAAPKASADAYKLGAQLCNNLLATLDERDQALVRAGYRAAQADANTKVTSQALEARRNYLMSWPQYAREQDQRGEIQRQQTNGANLVKESVKVDWANKSAELRKALDAQYARYRDALRQGGK